LIEPVSELADVRLSAVLKNHAKLDMGLFCSVDESVGTRGADFNRFFREDVEALTGGGNALRSVEAGGTADDYKIHRAMFQEGVELLIRRAAVFAAETGDFFGVGSMDGGDFDSGDGTCSASVGLGDVAAADEADVESHGK
jgi:hypothetical protein